MLGIANGLHSKAAMFLPLLLQEDVITTKDLKQSISKVTLQA
jgi:hypothetical protein